MSTTDLLRRLILAHLCGDHEAERDAMAELHRYGLALQWADALEVGL